MWDFVICFCLVLLGDELVNVRDLLVVVGLEVEVVIDVDVDVVLVFVLGLVIWEMMMNVF